MKELELAKTKYKENKAFLNKLNKNQVNKLDAIAAKAHTEEFKSFDCLGCANCCKTTGPLFTKADIQRLAKLLGQSVTQFQEQYLKVDEDGDFVLQQTPCPFLLENNECFVYDHRPKACREFPHTDRKNFFQIRNLTLKNTLICPITYNVLEKIKQRI
jgi:Fe-S-cluster containining protein